MKFLIPLLAFSICSCAPKLSSDQKSQIQSVMVLKPEVPAQSYTEPQGGSSAARNTATAAGAMGGAGAIGGIVGSLIGEGIYSAQHANFKRTNGTSFNSIKSQVPTNIEASIQKEISKQVASNAFFANKIKPSAPYQFQCKVSKHGLQRMGKKEGTLLLSPYISAEFFLLTPDGKKWIKMPAVQGVAKQGSPLQDYLKNEKLMSQGYVDATAQFGIAFGKALTKATK